MNKFKDNRSALALFVIFAILLTTIATSNASAQTNFPNQAFKADSPEDLSAGFDRFARQRTNNLLNKTENSVFGSGFIRQARNDAGSQRKSWARRNWWIFPALAGVGFGIYILARNNNSSSGILCRDGTISNAANTQGACSYHGGIAR